VKLSEAKSPSLIDGGDVLYAGGMLFVGTSRSVTPLELTISMFVVSFNQGQVPIRCLGVFIEPQGKQMNE
jgi:hypothetical protein